MTKRWSVILCCLSAAAALSCESPAPSLTPAVSELAGQLRRWEAFGFSGAVLISQGDRVLLSSGYGSADRRTRRKIDAHTLFDIGSLSKQFTAAAVLALVDDGALDLRAPLSRLLHGVPPDKAEITVHQLLTHTSGIEDGTDDGSARTRDDAVRQILATPLATAPGAAYAYSNDGYALLAAIAEVVSGSTFEDLLRLRLFEPAGMPRTTVAWRATATRDEVALGYGGYQAPNTGEDPRRDGVSWRGRGNGSVLSSIAELHSWHRALHDGRVLRDATRASMFESHTTAEADFLKYGYGWRVQTTSDGARLIWHSGLDNAFSAMLRYYPVEDVLLVFLTNQSIGGVPMREVLVPPSRAGPPSSALLAEAVARVPEYERSAGALGRFAGRYEVGPAAALVLTAVGDAIELRAEGQAAVDALFPPPDSAAALANAGASQLAETISRCLIRPNCERAELSRIDPLNFAERPSARVRTDWRTHASQLGPLRSVRALSTTAVRARDPSRRVTTVRLEFARGTVDEHVLWFADDEWYWIPGQPATTSITFRQAGEQELVGFDLLKQRVYHITLTADGITLEDREVGRTLRAPHHRPDVR
jgi:CubicO group peptidase (beta-lactamase class C family)